MNITEFDKQRHKILDRLNILESHLKKDLNEIATLAAEISKCPVSLISFYDSSSQIIKAKIGFDNSELPRENSLCSLVLDTDNEPLVINDLKTNVKFSSHPFVKANKKIRFYAGLALYNSEGLKVGTICVMDTKPRFLSTIQLSALRNLSVQATDLIIQKLDKTEDNSMINSSYQAPELADAKSSSSYSSPNAYNEIFQQMFQLSLIPTLIYDLDLNIMNVNDSAIQELGYSREELRSIKVYELHPHSEQKKYKKDLEAIITKDNFSILTKVQRKNGTIFQAEATQCKFKFGNKTLIHVFIKNINEKIKMEKENLSLARILQRSLNEIYIFDTKSLKFQYVNRGALENLGFNMDEMKKLTPLDIKPEFSPEKFKETIQPLLTGKEVLIVFETVHKRKDQSLYNVEVHLQKMEYKSKEVFTAIIIDTTQKTQNIKQLKVLNDKITKSNSRLKHFAASTAHDLQEPLRMVSSFSNVLKNKYEEQLDDKAKTYLDYINDGSERMKKLIENILEYTEIEAGDFKKVPIDLYKVLKQVINDLNVQIEARNAEIHIPNFSITAQSEYMLLYRVFLNLLSNAIKYTAVDTFPIIHIEAKEFPDYWKFSVKDNGIGIKKEYQLKVFELFTRLHSRYDYKGTGMGLAIVDRIISLHKGKLWLESVEGKGSCFYFTIPK